MKYIFPILLVFAASTSQALIEARGGGRGGSSRTTRVHGYTKKNGKYVATHRRTSKNSTKKDNWSHRGNVNPDTGKVGSKND